MLTFFFSSRRRHTRYWRDWSSDVCSSDLTFESNCSATASSAATSAANCCRSGKASSNAYAAAAVGVEAAHDYSADWTTTGVQSARATSSSAGITTGSSPDHKTGAWATGAWSADFSAATPGNAWWSPSATASWGASA